MVSRFRVSRRREKMECDVETERSNFNCHKRDQNEVLKTKKQFDTNRSTYSLMGYFMSNAFVEL